MTCHSHCLYGFTCIPHALILVCVARNVVFLSQLVYSFADLLRRYFRTTLRMNSSREPFQHWQPAMKISTPLPTVWLLAGAWNSCPTRDTELFIAHGETKRVESLCRAYATLPRTPRDRRRFLNHNFCAQLSAVLMEENGRCRNHGPNCRLQTLSSTERGENDSASKRNRTLPHTVHSRGTRRGARTWNRTGRNNMRLEVEAF